MPRAWLFTRGPESVRIVRVEDSHSAVRLFVYGPASDLSKLDFKNVAECMTRQAEIEQQFLGAGYQFAGLRSADRRHEGAIWDGLDRRRAAS